MTTPFEELVATWQTSEEVLAGLAEVDGNNNMIASVQYDWGVTERPVEFDTDARR
ncbi:MAG: hypothetical protein ACJ73S_30040 [Mycobacteriales bacterium]|jgi:hypothetical protein